MAKIRQLSPSVVNKIAAGEVIERPASVVKELLENSLDAGATRIDVSVTRGGGDLIRICDNGHGIEPDDLPLAVASHATSKIFDADDLFRVGTLGFRGEALASIAEVSHLVIRSRTHDSAGGAQIEVHGGRQSAVEPCGCPTGTTIEIADLFFNTPVRRRFLRSTQTEMGHITEAVLRVALARPDVHFTLRHNEREIYDLPPADPWSQRIGRLFGDDLSQALIEVGSTDDTIRLWGYVAHPSHSRSHQKMQYLFINGRHIRDRALQHALGEAYRGLLLTGRYPISFLRIDLPADLVDVNVHPTKLEVRFQDAGRLYSQLLSTLRTKFLTTDLTTQLQPTPSVATFRAPSEIEQTELLAKAGQAAQARRELVDWAKQEMLRWEPANHSDQSTAPPAPESENAPPLEVTQLTRPWTTFDPDQSWTDSNSEPESADSTANLTHSVPIGTSSDSQSAGRALQVHNRYLIAESEEGVVVIDQHALHERILYEQLCEKVEAGKLESQSLLVPEPVDLSGAEAATALDNRDLIAKLGIQIEPFGGDTILVSSYPAMLANMRPGEILRGIVEQLLASGKTPDRSHLMEDLLHSVACKAAIKAGDRLTVDEIEALLEQRHRYRNTHHCPHGRPTELVFTRDELDKQFKRT